MLAKSLTLGSDNVTYDLEDAVTESAKPSARVALRAHLEGLAAAKAEPGTSAAGFTTEIAVRINAVSTPHALADLTELGPRALSAVDAIVVPKVNTAGDLSFVADVVRHLRGSPEALASHSATGTPTKPPPRLLALIESARAVIDLREICSAGRSPTAPSSLHLDGLIFAAEDFALDLSLTRTPSLAEFQYARSAVVTAARAFGLESVLDLVCTSFRGEAGLAALAAESRAGRGMGFTGKQCIHPTQVAVVQQVFGRTHGAEDRAELAWAVRVLVAEAKSAAGGRGAFALDGAMIDAPVVGKAQRLVAQVERAGGSKLVQSLRDEYRDQEPE